MFRTTRLTQVSKFSKFKVPNKLLANPIGYVSRNFSAKNKTNICQVNADIPQIQSINEFKYKHSLLVAVMLKHELVVIADAVYDKFIRGSRKNLDKKSADELDILYQSLCETHKNIDAALSGIIDTFIYLDANPDKASEVFTKKSEKRLNYAVVRTKSYHEIVDKIVKLVHGRD